MIDCVVRLFQQYIFTDIDRKKQSLCAFPVLFKCKILYLSPAFAGLIAILHIKWLFVNHAAKVRKIFKILEMS